VYDIPPPVLHAVTSTIAPSVAAVFRITLVPFVAVNSDADNLAPL
jgi:hypothetical protein